jgi:hypothetical protein
VGLRTRGGGGERLGLRCLDLGSWISGDHRTVERVGQRGERKSG